MLPLIKKTAAIILLLVPLTVLAEPAKTLKQKSTPRIEALSLLLQVGNIEKIIEKQNQAYEKLKKREVEISANLKKIKGEEEKLSSEIHLQRMKIVRKMRILFPYKRNNIVNYIFGETRKTWGSFFRKIELFKIAAKKDSKLINEYKHKIDSVLKKKKSSNLSGKA